MADGVKFDLLEFGINEKNRKKIILKTIETYPMPWVVVHEAVQNSLDATQKSNQTEGRVSITLNLDKQEVKVQDNGRGFHFDLSLLLYGGTDKDTDLDAPILGGNIGVGIKTVIFSSKSFELESVVNGQIWRLKVLDAYKYASLDKLIPEVKEPEPCNKPNGTSICYSFPDEKVTEFVRMLYDDYARKVDDKLAGSPEEKLTLGTEYYFRSYSYAGNTNRLLGIGGIKPSKITLSLLCSEESTLGSIPEIELKGILRNNSRITVTFENKHWDIREAIDRTRRGYPKPQPISQPLPEGGRFTRQGPNYVYVQSFVGEQGLEKLLRNPYLHEPIDVNVHRTFFSQCLGAYLVVGSADTIRPYVLGDVRQFICAQGIPSDHLIDKPKAVGELGYLANICCILNLDTRLNYGKQNITNKRLLGYANSYFTDAFRATLRNIATAFAGKTRIPPPPSPVEILQRRDIGLSSLTIIKEPSDENEVIAIFYELVGKGHLTNVQTWHLSSREPYDGKIIMKLPHDKGFPVPHSNKDFQTLEFKIRVWDLVHDFEAQTKDPQFIDLLVAWQDDYSDTRNPHPDYEIIDVRMAPGMEEQMPKEITKCLHARHIARFIPLLILKDVIDTLLQSQ